MRTQVSRVALLAAVGSAATLNAVEKFNRSGLVFAAWV
jgi:hypothetical protein